MFVQNIYPVLVNTGFLQIRYYGLVYVIGFLLVYYFLLRKKEKLGADREQIETLLIWLIAGLFVGARVFHFLFSDPLLVFSAELFRIWHGGMSFFGGFLGAFLAGYYYLRKNRLNAYAFADIVVIAGTIALVLGRIANFINSELVGTASSLPWCVVFPAVDNICRHPYQVYASISHLALLFGLIFAWKMKEKKQLKDGIVLLTFLIGYSLLRFGVDFFRADTLFFGLTVWQHVSVLFLIVGLVWMRIRMKNG